MPMNRILVVNINWLGDAIFSTPVFKALKDAHPQAHVACLCVPRVAEVLRYCPFIDEIIVNDEKGKDRWPWSKVRLIGRLRRAKFDAAFLLHRSLSRALLVFLAGIPRRIGYGKAKWLLTNPVEYPGEDTHRSDVYLHVVEAYGIAPKDRRCQLRLAAADMQSIEQKLKSHGINLGDSFLVFNTGGNWDLKRWPLPLWAQLVRRAAQDSKTKIVFSGASKDTPDARKVMELSGVPGIDLTGQTSLGESLALFRRASVVVSADSGPLHLANSVGAKVVGLFGPTRPEITGPRGAGQADIVFKHVGCNQAPCYHLSCRSNVCMQAIGVEDVWQAVQKCTG
jgi:lipopolysaccharide heptosyltransferase II